MNTILGAARLSRLFLLPLTAAMVLPHCGPVTDKITGNSRAKSEGRDVPPFTRVASHDGIAVTIHTGESQAITVNARRDTVGHVKTAVDGDTLNISLSGFVPVGGGISVDLAVPTLNGVAAADQSTISVVNPSASDLAVAAKDNGRVFLSGHADKAEFEFHGNGGIDAGALTVDAATVNGSDNGAATLSITKELTGTLSDNSAAEVHLGSEQTVLTVTVKDNASLRKH